MDVPSWSFLAFAAIGALAYNLNSAYAWRSAVLIVCNLAFVASFAASPATLAPFGLFLLAGYAAIGAAKRRPESLAILLGVLIAAFFWLKQYAFVPHGLFLTAPYVTIGLSYVFFRVLHLVIDARDERTPMVGLVDYINYTLNFTCLFAGPIQRFDDYKRTAKDAPAALDLPVLAASAERILIGLAKVMVLASILAKIRTNLLAEAQLSDQVVLSALYLAGAIATFPVYLYWNFSGYVDVVIGVARWFRIELPENFNKPFLAASFIDYWNRWHMTLSNWLKTYVYNPLLMTLMRRYRSPKLEPYFGAAALFVTFFLIGAWHGQTTAFLMFGVLNGAGVAINQLYRTRMVKRMGRKPYNELCKRATYTALCRGFTLSWVAFTLIWFWAPWGQIAGLSAKLGVFGVSLSLTVVFLACTVSLWLLIGGREWLAKGAIGRVLAAPLPRAIGASAAVGCIALAQIVLQSPAPEIIYKSF